MKSDSVFQPALGFLFRGGYTWKKFGRDLIAGLIVGIVALPLSIAFAIASGVSPDRGLITAVVAGFLISVFSGSRFQIGGPTGAFIVIVYGVVQQFGYDGLAVATMMAGIILVVMGLTRMGDMIKYIPYPVTVGFTGGIAVIIFTSQIRDFVGIRMDHVPEQFFMKWVAYFQNIANVNPHALIIGGITVAVLVGWPKITRRVPGPLVAILACSCLVAILDWPVETIGSRFGTVSAGWPMVSVPQWDWNRMVVLFPSALTIALLAGIESLLSAVVADGMTGKRHHSNTELIAQGIANMASPLWGGIPATGAIARTATSIKNGAYSPLAGVTHALVILVIFLFCGHWAEHIPMSVLAGILMMVAYHMGEWHLFWKMRKSPRSDIIVLMVTFLLTILVDLTVAIQFGVVLASFLFMRRMSSVSKIGFLECGSAIAEEDVDVIRGIDVPEGVEIFEIQGPFFFGAAIKFKDSLSAWERLPKILILRLRHVPVIDATGLQALEELMDQTRCGGGFVILSGVRQSLRLVLSKAGLVDRIGAVNVTVDIDRALERARALLENCSI
jgi:sulfate permease, SulP family